MTVETTPGPLQWLREAAAAGEVHTVRVSWADRLGTWRGKRLPVDVFLGGPERRIGFGDGMIVVDVNGGALALGHALGNSGTRLTVTLLHEMERRGARYGIASLCIAAGQGIATLFERVEG